MKNTFLTIFALLSINLFSQTDTIVTGIYSEITLSTRNIWRGVDFGNYSPTFQGLFSYDPVKNLELGTFVSGALTNKGYGNTLNLFAKYKRETKIGRVSLTIDDYYFNGDSTNYPTEYLKWEESHLVEARFELERDRVSFLAGYMIYGGSLYTNPSDSLGNVILRNDNAFYLEGSFYISKKVYDSLKLSVGYLTGPSALNFHDRAGITNVSLKYQKYYREYPIFFQVTYNPNYKFISPVDMPRVGYGMSQMNWSLGIVF